MGRRAAETLVIKTAEPRCAVVLLFLITQSAFNVIQGNIAELNKHNAMSWRRDGRYGYKSVLQV